MKTVAVVSPWYLRTTVTPDEEIAFRHLEHFLGRYDRFLIIPKDLKIELPGFRLKRIPHRYFGSSQANARLMLSRWFYEMFSDYRYILIYQSDALVFSDQLLEWCEKDFDYVGAPWIPCSDTPHVKTPRVGNGGFSLRKIESFLGVFNSKRYWVEPSEYWREFRASRSAVAQLLNLPRKWLKSWSRFNGARRAMAQWHLRDDGRTNEDYFWSDEAVRYLPEFRIPPVEIGFRFAFEVAPRVCYELNGRELPFGTHAWARYDRAFWEPYLLR